MWEVIDTAILLPSRRVDVRLKNQMLWPRLQLQVRLLFTHAAID
jgi:hypothetical protein